MLSYWLSKLNYVYPTSREPIKMDYWVDDFLGSTQAIDEAIKLRS